MPNYAFYQGLQPGLNGLAKRLAGGAGIRDTAEAAMLKSLGTMDVNQANADKLRAEAAAMQQRQAARDDTAGFVSGQAGVPVPLAQRFVDSMKSGNYGVIPGFAPNDDEGNKLPEAAITQVPPELAPHLDRLKRALQTLTGLRASATSNPDQIAQSAGHYQQQGITDNVQQRILEGEDMTRSSAMNQAAKPGQAIKLYDDVGATGATMDQATGAVRTDNPLAQANINKATATAPLNEARVREIDQRTAESKARTGYNYGAGEQPQATPQSPPAPGGTGATIDINNPGGIRPVGSSTGFQKFNTPEDGIRAIDQNLAAYGKIGLNTIEGIVNRWAPPSENNTRQYVADVSRTLGIAPNAKIDLANPLVRHALTTAIMLKEQGASRIFAPGAGAATQVGAAPPAVASNTQMPPEIAALPKAEQAKWLVRQRTQAAGKKETIEDPLNPSKAILVDPNTFNIERYKAGDKTGFFGYSRMPTAAGAAEIKAKAEESKATDADRRAMAGALKTAGYNPATGTDDIEKLIDESSSGLLQKGASAAASAVGIATKGRVATNTLRAAANKITLDLMNRKLGAGISNADRDFIVGQLGDVGNDARTSEERKAAWRFARSRMMEVGLVSAPKESAPAAATGGGWRVVK